LTGIYNDEFITFLEEYCGRDNIKIKTNNIIIPCVWCEYDENKSHYHLWISTEAPIFHCFKAGCPKSSGIVPQLVKKIKGVDISDKFVDKSLLKKQKELKKAPNEKLKDIYIPEINEDKFKLKTLFIRKRLGFNNFDIQSVKGLIFDVNKFIDGNINRIKFGNNILRLRDYLHSNFVGFLTDQKCVAIFRNMDNNSKFGHFKIKLQDNIFPDYYRLSGADPKSNHVVLAEGVFDILNERIFDSLNMRCHTKLYAAGLSPHYQSLIKSIVFNEKTYRLNITVLSDRDVSLKYYKNLKFYNKHIINSLIIYYNKGGKDFNVFPIIPEKFIIN